MKHLDPSFHFPRTVTALAVCAILAPAYAQTSDPAVIEEEVRSMQASVTLGAGLAIPAKLKIFDWLKRRPQCGRECRFCETKCTVGAIDPLGRINVNECVLCLRCQVIMNDSTLCPVLKRRVRAPEGAPT